MLLLLFILITPGLFRLVCKEPFILHSQWLCSNISSPPPTYRCENEGTFEGEIFEGEGLGIRNGLKFMKQGQTMRGRWSGDVGTIEIGWEGGDNFQINIFNLNFQIIQRNITLDDQMGTVKKLYLDENYNQSLIQFVFTFESLSVTTNNFTMKFYVNGTLYFEGIIMLYLATIMIEVDDSYIYLIAVWDILADANAVEQLFLAGLNKTSSHLLCGQISYITVLINEWYAWIGWGSWGIFSLVLIAIMGVSIVFGIILFYYFKYKKNLSQVSYSQLKTPGDNYEDDYD